MGIIKLNGKEYGGSEGASVLEDLTDISLNNLTNGQILKYNTTTQKWENSDESGEIPDVQLFEALTYTEVKASSVVSPFTIANNTLTSVSSSMTNSETNILSTGTFDLTDINIIEVVVDSATFYQGGNWNGFFYVCDDDTNVRNNTYPSVAHKIMFSNTSTPLKYSLDVSQLNGQWFIGVCTGGHTNLVVSAVAIGSGLTGHVIIDKNNVDMSQRSGLQFTGNVTVTDDSTNDKTVVSIQGTSIDDTTASGSTTYSSNKTNTLLSGKVDKVNGKGLSTNDYTTAEKTKLAGIEAGAEVNPTSGVKTATESFETVDGGLLSKCQINLIPVQSGSGDPSPDNVRPISGHTEVDLQVDGKNLLNPTNAFGSFSGYTINTDGSVTVTETDGRTWDNIAPIPLKAGTYTLSRDVTVGRTAVRTSDNNYGSDIIIFEGRTSISFTLAQDGGIKVKANYSGTYPITIKFQLEQGNQATPYEPYLGHLYQVQIGSTVYGGYVDLVSGVMNVDRVIFEHLENINFSYASIATVPFFDSVPTFTPDIDLDKLSLSICSDYKFNMIAMTGANDGTFYITASKHIRFCNLSYTDADAFKATLAGVKLVYYVATPITIQLTPQQIEALVGQNNLSCPLSGQSIETNGVEYKELFTFADVVNRVDVKAGTGEESVVMNHINGSYTNTASGRWSTATGYNSTSSGDFSYTEGYGCIASALYTHAEGVGNQATSRASHAEGDTNKAIANSAHAEGYDTIAGYYNESTQTYTGTSSHAEGISTRTYGNGSHAEGWQSRAEAIYSHAEGEITVASAEAAHTEGIQTTASGYAAHAEGASSQATGNYSHVEGSYDVASGNCSHAGGLRSEASSNQSFAHGNTVTASNKFSAAFGISNYEKLSSGDNDNTYTLFSVGNGTIVQSGTTYVKDTPSNAFEVRKNGTVIEGSGCGANGNAAHAEGNGTHANGNCSHAEGNIGTASGYAAHVEGNGCTASGDDAHAEGAWTIASGVVSHAGGDASQARGYASYAMGKEAIAGGNESFASGYKVNAAASRSFTHGYFTLVSNPDEVAFGVANSEVLSTTDPTAYTVFAIGNGTVENEVATARSNVFEVRSNGDVLANNSKLISVSELQTIVASCTDFSDFKTAIAAL